MRRPHQKVFGKLYLVRHGQSEGNVNVNTYNTTIDGDIKLTEVGHQQSVEAGKILSEEIQKEPQLYTSGWPEKPVPYPTFFVSPYKRTQETYQGIHDIVKHKTVHVIPEKFIEDPRLREQEFSGKLSVFDTKQVREQLDQGRFWYRYEHGESIADTYDRASGFLLDRLQPCWGDRNSAVIVSHGMTIRCLLMRLLDLTVFEFSKLRNPKNCQIICLESNQYDQWEIISELERRK
jgi:broad specificity phosphatase PhoE